MVRSTAPGSSKSRTLVKVEESLSDTDTDILLSSDGEYDEFKDQMARAQEIFQRLHRRSKILKKENKKRARDMEDLREVNEAIKRKPGSTDSLQRKVQALQSVVQSLERARENDKKRTRKLKQKEIEREAKDLEDPADKDVEDTVHSLRKLLRRLHDLILINTLDEDEKCPICLEILVLKKCSSFPCQHLVCNQCLGKLGGVDWKVRSEGERGEEVTTCPQCRETVPRDDVELVHYTATQRWDEMLKVAAEWAAMDRGRAGTATTDEEEAEEFINDESSGTNAGSSAQSGSDDAVTREATPESDIAVDRAETPETPPQPIGAHSYHQSPSKDKRKLMESLASERSKKKRK